MWNYKSSAYVNFLNFLFKPPDGGFFTSKEK